MLLRQEGHGAPDRAVPQEVAVGHRVEVQDSERVPSNGIGAVSIVILVLLWERSPPPPPSRFWKVVKGSQKETTSNFFGGPAEVETISRLQVKSTHIARFTRREICLAWPCLLEDFSVAGPVDGDGERKVARLASASPGLNPKHGAFAHQTFREDCVQPSLQLRNCVANLS